MFTHKDIGKRSTLKNKHNTQMFLFFLASSFVFLMLVKLSNEYTNRVPVNLEYTNLPQGKLLEKTYDDTLSISIRATGFELLKYRLFKRTATINLQDIKPKNKTRYYQLTENIKAQIENQLENDVELFAVYPDTLFFNIGISKSKKVPVVADLDLNFQLGYHLKSDLLIKPDSIVVSGHEIYIDTIKAAYTFPKQLDRVNQSFSMEIPLRLSKDKDKVQYSSKQVTIDAAVEKFTEANYKIPIRVVNLPDNFTVKTFPEEIELTFQISVNDYNEISESDFVVACDYQKAVENNLTYLIPEVVKKPTSIKGINITPEKIDFLLQHD
ncbi:MAG: hypothetical protein CSA39_04290 [Flavobacteriales bacterium]|nr:MAG: hypothetical protein CSA39_04290 [Flavobacteriales bacterium]